MKLDIKRLYIPFDMDVKCPSCGIEETLNSKREYLSYPDTEVKQWIYWMCSNCNSELQMLIDFDIKLNPQYCSIKEQ